MKLNEETGFYENYGFDRVPFWQTNWFFVAMIIILVAMLALICFLLLKHVLKKRAEKKLSPKQQILQDLAIIELMVHVGHAHNEAYFMLTSAIKNFLIHQHHLPIAHKTASEILQYLPTTILSRTWVDLVTTIFSKSELIIFGGSDVQSESILSIIKRVKELVESDVNKKETPR